MLQQIINLFEEILEKIQMKLILMMNLECMMNGIL